MEFVFNFFLLLLVFPLFASFSPPVAIGSVLLFFAFIAVVVLACNFVMVCLRDREETKGKEKSK